ncbi:hypothetical protein HDV00_002128 [Rhizophlyctis rosea]|nr:hypothetical protein HDV00_002128 [Rhizophlyctis rosea]
MDTVTKMSNPISLPCSIASLPGRKHQYGQLLVNEDLAGTFAFAVDSLDGNGREDGAAFFLMDGHGESMVAPLSMDARKRWTGSKGENFVQLLNTLLRQTVEALYKEAFEQWEKEKTGGGSNGNVWDFPSENALPILPGEDVTSPARYQLLITNKLQSLRHVLDKKLTEKDEPLCRDNGSTLLLGLVAYAKVWFCSIGDSSMMLFHKSTGEALRVWQRPGEDVQPQPCSYEDTLANYPKACHEGQTIESVGRDLKKLKSVRKLTNKGGFPYYPLMSPKSPYELMIDRTIVYNFELSELQKMASPNSVIAVLVSDGVYVYLMVRERGGCKKLKAGHRKDMLVSRVIGQLLASPESVMQSYKQRETKIDALLTAARASRTPDRFDVKAAETLLEHLMSLDGNPPDLATYCDCLVNLAVLRGSRDDVTALAVELNPGTASGSATPTSTSVERTRNASASNLTPGKLLGPSGRAGEVVSAIIYSAESPILSLVHEFDAYEALNSHSADSSRVLEEGKKEVGDQKGGAGRLVSDGLGAANAAVETSNALWGAVLIPGKQVGGTKMVPAFSPFSPASSVDSPNPPGGFSIFRSLSSAVGFEFGLSPPAARGPSGDRSSPMEVDAAMDIDQAVAGEKAADTSVTESVREEKAFTGQDHGNTTLTELEVAAHAHTGLGPGGMEGSCTDNVTAQNVGNQVEPVDITTSSQRSLPDADNPEQNESTFSSQPSDISTDHSQSQSQNDDATPRPSAHLRDARTPPYEITASQQTVVKTPARNLLSVLQDVAREDGEGDGGAVDGQGGMFNVDAGLAGEASASQKDAYDSDMTQDLEDELEMGFVSMESVALDTDGREEEEDGQRNGIDSMDWREDSVDLGSRGASVVSVVSVDLAGSIAPLPTQLDSVAAGGEGQGDDRQVNGLGRLTQLSEQRDDKSDATFNGDDDIVIESSQPPFQSAFFTASGRTISDISDGDGGGAGHAYVPDFSFGYSFASQESSDGNGEPEADGANEEAGKSAESASTTTDEAGKSLGLSDGPMSQPRSANGEASVGDNDGNVLGKRRVRDGECEDEEGIEEVEGHTDTNRSPKRPHLAQTASNDALSASLSQLGQADPYVPEPESTPANYIPASPSSLNTVGVGEESTTTASAQPPPSKTFRPFRSVFRSPAASSAPVLEDVHDGEDREAEKEESTPQEGSPKKAKRSPKRLK